MDNFTLDSIVKNLHNATRTRSKRSNSFLQISDSVSWFLSYMVYLAIFLSFFFFLIGLKSIPTLSFITLSPISLAISALSGFLLFLSISSLTLALS